MAIEIPDFDFASYNPRDVWRFPPQRLVRFAAEAYTRASASRGRVAQRHLHPDQRFVIFHELSGLAHALLLGAMHLRSHGNDEVWWDLQPEFGHLVDARTMASNNMAVRQLLQLGYVQGGLRQLDTAIRQYAAALGLNLEMHGPLQRTYKGVLAACESTEYAPLLKLLQIFRDGISQLHRFCPADGLDLRIKYLGRDFHFQASKEIMYNELGFIDDWDFLNFLMAESDSMLHRLHDSIALSTLPFIATRYLD
jgi:hypothetical protein